MSAQGESVRPLGGLGGADQETVHAGQARHSGAMGWVGRARWNPYVVGAGIGVLSWLVFAVVNNPIGVTTSLGQWSGLVAEPVMGEAGLKANAYWAKSMPAWDYGTLFLIG
jgi:hypothetical protein